MRLMWTVLIAFGLLVVPPIPAGAQVTAFDEDPATTERVNTSDPYVAAITIARLRFPATQTAEAVVLSRVDAFADSLAAAPLTARGPLLFAQTGGIPADTLDELRRVAAPSATVYLLGGKAAPSPAIEVQVDGLGYNAVRLAGPSRIETSVAVAEEVRRLYPDRTAAVVARADNPEDNPTAAWAEPRRCVWSQITARTTPASGPRSRRRPSGWG